MDLLIMVGFATLLFLSLILVAIGLFSAPWQLLLVFLLGVWLVSQWWLRGMQASVPLPPMGDGAAVVADPPRDEGITAASPLSYRGAHYGNATEVAAAISIEQARLERAGKYRGCAWKNGSQPVELPPRPVSEMKYRGIRIQPPSSSAD